MHQTVMVKVAINIKLSAGLLIAPYNIYRASRSVIEITNSSFHDSSIEIRARENGVNANDIAVMIKNTSFMNCSHWSTLTFRGINHPFLSYYMM